MEERNIAQHILFSISFDYLSYWPNKNFTKTWYIVHISTVQGLFNPGKFKPDFNFTSKKIYLTTFFATSSCDNLGSNIY